MRNGLIIDGYGSKKHYLNGLIHREGGPAIEDSNGDRSWWQNDLLHRLDGPAVDYVNGYKAWYFHGKYIECNSQEEFEEKIKLIMFW
jgi:hypothetical protein